MIKRLLGVVCAGIELMPSSPVIVLVFWQARRKMGNLTLFRQAYPGIDGTLFKIIKFLTIKDVVSAKDRPPPQGSERMIGPGQLLRATSLNELSKFWNVR